MKLRNKVWITALCVLLAIALPAAAATMVIETNAVSIVLNGENAAAAGENIPGSQDPYSILYNNTVYLPIRQISGQLDLDVHWDEGTKTVSVYSGITEETKIPLGNLGTATQAQEENAILEALFFDVGQADCILLRTGGHNMLIDAGNTGQDRLILGYLAEHEVDALDYLVATHPHADHIGAMASVVNTMGSIGEVIMPDVVHTTKTYENLLIAIEDKNIPLTMAKPGDEYTLGDASILVLAPVSVSGSDLNEVSVVLRVTFGDTVFLFTGDAGTKSENAQIASGLPLQADVLKVGHHGSRTSSTQNYLDAVRPRYAVISCGTGNTYGHPHIEAMARLTASGAAIYRTDESGTVMIASDGKEIFVSVEWESSPPEILISFIGNKNSKIFHLPSCRNLPQESNAVYFVTRQEALEASYSPCGTCKP
ncbi:MAG: MBL fold metallo-hydrolase [Clostridiales bacterium]|nr:MBL fold metallo-hydrolase [Clostridiales bacterium]